MVAIIQRLILLTLGIAPLVLPVQAGSSLLVNSPFLPLSGPAGTAQEGAPLELRSVFKAGEEYEFSLYDSAKKQSTWIRLDEPGHDFVVKAYDPEKDTVTVELRNRLIKLTLKEAKIAQLTIATGQPLAAVASAPQTVASRGQPSPALPGRDEFGPASAGRGLARPSPALPPEHLRNREDDINRRRELRQQGDSSPGPGTPPAVPSP
jgi:hypothetical protein